MKVGIKYTKNIHNYSKMNEFILCSLLGMHLLRTFSV